MKTRYLHPGRLRVAGLGTPYHYPPGVAAENNQRGPRLRYQDVAAQLGHSKEIADCIRSLGDEPFSQTLKTKAHLFDKEKYRDNVKQVTVVDDPWNVDFTLDAGKEIFQRAHLPEPVPNMYISQEEAVQLQWEHDFEFFFGKPPKSKLVRMRTTTSFPLWQFPDYPSGSGCQMNRGEGLIDPPTMAATLLLLPALTPWLTMRCPHYLTKWGDGAKKKRHCLVYEGSLRAYSKKLEAWTCCPLIAHAIEYELRKGLPQESAIKKEVPPKRYPLRKTYQELYPITKPEPKSDSPSPTDPSVTSKEVAKTLPTGPAGSTKTLPAAPTQKGRYEF